MLSRLRHRYQRFISVPNQVILSESLWRCGSPCPCLGAAICKLLSSQSDDTIPDISKVTTFGIMSKRKARELLSRKEFPVGTFGSTQFNDAKRALQILHQMRNDADAVNLTIKLLYRLVEELATKRDLERIKWLCSPAFCTRLVNAWKVASVEKLNVLSPKALVDKLQDMSKKLPEFRISAITMGMVLDVMIKTTDRKQAPFLAEEFLRFLESESTTYRDLKPHVYIYTQVINAWVKSGFPEAESKITSLRRRMEDAGVSPTMVTYNTLLRFYGTQANASMITQLLEEMQKAKNVTPDLVTYNEAVYGYARAEDMENAQRIFERMLGLKERDGVKKGDILGEAAQQILLAYRNMVESASSRSNRSNIITAMGKAEDFFKKYIERESRLSSSSMDQLTGTIMDIFAKAGVHESVEEFATKRKLNVAQLTILVKALGKNNLAERANAIVLDNLVNRTEDSTHIIPNIALFNTLINAWVDSSSPDKFDRAMNVLRLVEEDPRCKELEIEPNAATFGFLLKCLVNSPEESADAGKKAIELLEEMDRRRRATGNSEMKPNVIAVTLAIKACLISNDLDNYDMLLNRFEKTGAPLNVRTYNEILLHWSRVAGKLENEDAADRAEEVLQHMRELALSGRPDLAPDLYSYTLVATALQRSGDDDAGLRIWTLCEMMSVDNLEMNPVAYLTFITALASMENSFSLEKADYLLRCLEQSENPEFLPNSQHYHTVIKGWLQIGYYDQASQVLLRSLDLAVKRNVKNTLPTPQLIDMVMQGFLKWEDELDGATLFIDKLERYKKIHMLPVGPNLRTYTHLLWAWRKSQSPDRDIQVTRLIGIVEKLTEKNKLEVRSDNETLANSNVPEAVHITSFKS